MKERMVFVLALALLFTSPVAFHAEAQSPLPDVEIECEPAVRIPVYPGSTLSGFINCNIQNPSTSSEEVSIEVNSGSLVAAHPNSVSVAAGSDVAFVVSFRAETGMDTQAINVDVEATVTSWNNLPPPTEASDSTSSIAVIMQYSAPTISIEKIDKQMTAGSDYEVLISAGNNGNNVDKISVGITEYSLEQMESEGFQISIPTPSMEVESGDSRTFVIEIRAPKGGASNDELAVEFYAVSDYSCRYEGMGCNMVFVQSSILVSESEDEGVQGILEGKIMIIGGVSASILVAAAVIVVLKRRGSNSSRLEMDDEYEDEYYDDEYEDEDDLDDDFFDDL